MFVPNLPAPGESGALEGEERHHVVNVCRAVVGDVATATDGEGRRASIRLTATGARVSFEVESIDVVPRRRPACIACGAPEGTRGDWLIEKLAEFGIDRFQPVDAARGRWRWSPARAGRCDRLAVAALKQSHGVFRMKVLAPLPLAAWLETLEPGGARWVADPGGCPAPRLDAGIPFVAASGPAPGFTAGERSALEESGFDRVRLAAGTLRAETAGLALAALWAGAGDA